MSTKPQPDIPYDNRLATYVYLINSLIEIFARGQELNLKSEKWFQLTDNKTTAYSNESKVSQNNTFITKYWKYTI